jgi:hypothetical protein
MVDQHSASSASTFQFPTGKSGTRRIAVVALSLLGACAVPSAEIDVGYTMMAVSGDIALSSGTGGVSTGASQDIESAFGLGDDQGSVYVRAQLDLGSPVFTASGFMFSESGQGVLDATFGGISASTPVDTELDFANIKFSMTFDIPIGPVTIAPGLAVDTFDLHFKATETTLGNSEEIDEIVPVPLLFLRAQADLGPVSLVGEGGYIDIPETDGAEGKVLDLEARLDWQVFPMFALFAGYRRIDIDAKGETDTDSFAVDLLVDGWMVGGGIRF